MLRLEVFWWVLVGYLKQLIIAGLRLQLAAVLDRFLELGGLCCRHGG